MLIIGVDMFSAALGSAQQTTLCGDITVKQEKQEPGVESSGCDYPLPGGVIIKQEVVDGNKFTTHSLFTRCLDLVEAY